MIGRKSLIKFSAMGISLLLIITSLYYLSTQPKEVLASPETVNLTVTDCDTCDYTLIEVNDGSEETLDKNEVWKMNFTDLSCGSINSGEACVHIWAQDVPAGETVTFDCSVDGTTWDKCGTNTWAPTGSEVRYCYALSGVTCDNINTFVARLASNDAGAPDDFYVDYIDTYVDYSPPGDTTPPQWSNNATKYSSPVTYIPNLNHGFQVDWADTDSDVHTGLFEWDGSNNYTMSNSTSTYWYNITDLGVGTYTWKSYANNTDGYENVTDSWTYEVAKNGSATVDLFLNGTQGQYDMYQGESLNATAVLSEVDETQIEIWTNYSDGTWKLWDSGNTPLENTTQLNTTGFFNFTANFTNSNYTSKYDSYIVNVSIVYGWLDVSWHSNSKINDTVCTEGSPCEYNQYTTFTANATVTCQGDTYAKCGDVSGGIRYNESGSTMILINTTEGATPFFVPGDEMIPTYAENSTQEVTNEVNTSNDVYAISECTGTYCYSDPIYVNFTTSQTYENATVEWKYTEISYGYFECWNSTDWETLITPAYLPDSDTNESASISNCDNSDGNYTFKIYSWDGDGDSQARVAVDYIWILGIANPQSLGTLDQGDSVTVNFTINGTSLGTYKIDANFTSSYSQITENDTDDAIVKIVSAAPPEILSEIIIDSPLNTTYTSIPIDLNLTTDATPIGCVYNLNNTAPNITMTNTSGSDWMDPAGISPAAETHRLYTYCWNSTYNVTNSSVWFTLSVVDAAFSISMPGDYASWTSITGETEGGATSIDLISFNFSDIPEDWREPYQLGNASRSQNGPTTPIFYVDPTGNTDIDVSLRFSSSLPSGIVVGGNASCSGTYTSCQGSLQNISTSYVLLIDDLSQTDSFGNLTLYANVSSGTAPTGSSSTLYIKGND